MTLASTVRFASRRRAALFLLAMPLAACSSLPNLSSLPGLSSIKPFRIDIQQGNFLSPETVGQLKRGMTRDQVRFVLGTPLVTDIFHGDRWDYVFYRELGNGTKEQRRVSVFFDNDKLVRAVGEYVPAELAESVPADPQPAPEKAAAAAGETKN